MRRARPIRCGVVLFVIGAMLVLPMLPAEHVHASIDGDVVVHRHGLVVEAHGHPELAIDHDGSHSSVSLELHYVSERAFDVARPLTTVEAPSVAPDMRLVGLLAANDDPVAHGPPRPLLSLRGPPA